MYKNNRILCVIPARGGSKRLPGKNIRLLHGIPLIGYAIQAAKGSKYIDQIIVSTDDENIANVARDLGAEVLMRPAELSQDDTPTLPVLQHAVLAIEGETLRYDAIVLVQPTSPGVLTQDIDAAIEKLFESGANSCISVSPITDPPEWMYRRREDGMLEKYLPVQQQKLEELYRVNGAVYVSSRELLLQKRMIIDADSCASVVMPPERSVDIDTAFDFSIAEQQLSQDR